MYNILKKLIARNYYTTKAEIVERADVAYGMGKITESQYVELTALINEKYQSEES